MVVIDVLFWVFFFPHVHLRFLEMTQYANITLEPRFEPWLCRHMREEGCGLCPWTLRCPMAGRLFLSVSLAEQKSKHLDNISLSPHLPLTPRPNHLAQPETQRGIYRNILGEWRSGKYNGNYLRGWLLPGTLITVSEYFHGSTL